MAIVIIDEPCRRHGDRYCRAPECEPKCYYRRERVEGLLRARWNDGALFREERPEPDMAWRKAPNGDPKRSTDPWAEAIDINRAWDRADLDPNYRVVLHEYYADGTSQKAIAIVLGVSQQTISRWIYDGVSELMFQLNGKYPDKNDEEREEQ